MNLRSQDYTTHGEARDAARQTGGFTPFSHFPDAERALERLLVERSPFALPAHHAQRFARGLPWLCAAFLPLHALLALLAFGVLTFFGSQSWLSGFLGVATVSLDILALHGLFRRTKRGWALLSYSMCMSLLRSSLTFSLFGVWTSVLSLWLLFQAKREYGKRLSVSGPRG